MVRSLHNNIMQIKTRVETAVKVSVEHVIYPNKGRLKGRSTETVRKKYTRSPDVFTKWRFCVAHLLLLARFRRNATRPNEKKKKKLVE